MTWKVGLKGDSYEIHEMERAFSGSEPPWVRPNDEGTPVLESPELDGSADAVQAIKRAEPLLVQMIGAVRALDFSLGIVQPSGDVWDQTGSHHVAFAGTATGTARVYGVAVGTVEGAPPQPPPPHPARLVFDLGLTNEDIKDVERLLSTRELTWITLYGIWEIVKHDAGDSMYSRGWVTRRRAELFTRTANHPDGAGDDARHTRTGTMGPPLPMPLADGQELIAELLREWIRWIESGKPTTK